MFEEKDWTGNERTTFATLGASNHSNSERAENDYYATDPSALEALLNIETFSDNVWECACGGGHLSNVLENRGYNVRSTDLFYRGYGEGGVDFLKVNESFSGDIITNPPYKYAKEFVEKAINTVDYGNKVVMLLKIQFLEGKARKPFFEEYPPKKIYISSSRISCYRNGDFSDEQKKNNNAVAFAWFVWERGFCGDPIIKWFN